MVFNSLCCNILEVVFFWHEQSPVETKINMRLDQVATSKELSLWTPHKDVSGIFRICFLKT